MQEKNLPFEPYFYIIQHTKTDKLYAGCRFSKRPTNYSKNGCNQKEFLKTDGYITSSNIIQKIILEEGVDSFKIIQLMEESNAGIPIYQYETMFLQKYNIAERDNWFNEHNNYFYSFGTKQYEDLIFKKYGVYNIMDTEGIYDKIKLVHFAKYGMWANTSEEIQNKTKQTCLEKYGSEYYFQSDDKKLKSEITCLEKYGVTHQSKSEEIKIKKIQTSLKNWGTESPTQNEEVKATALTTNLEKYGAIHANCTIEVQTKRKENSLAKTGVDHFMKTEEHKKRQTEMQIGCRWTNNGIKNKRIYKNEEIPEGFKLGFLQKTSKK